MLSFSDCKINIGLDILRKRPDGYHDVETVMVHVPWHDIIEIIPSAGKHSTLTVLGNPVDCPPEKNLVMKAYDAMKTLFGLPAVDIVLQKIIPDGAGLGGGSADAATTIKMLNQVFNVGLVNNQMAEIASKLGADCSFFIYDTPMLCTGIGTEMKAIDLDLSKYKIIIAKPKGVGVSTKEAYASVTPAVPEIPLIERIKLPVTEWQDNIANAFQDGVCRLVPEIGYIITMLRDNGAIYAAMTGSGAAVFGIFDGDIMTETIISQLHDCDTFVG